MGQQKKRKSDLRSLAAWLPSLRTCWSWLRTWDVVIDAFFYGEDGEHWWWWLELLLTRSVMLQPRSIASQTMKAAERPNTTFKVKSLLWSLRHDDQSEEETRPETNTFREHLQRAIIDICDLWDIWSTLQRHLENILKGLWPLRHSFHFLQLKTRDKGTMFSGRIKKKTNHRSPFKMWHFLKPSKVNFCKNQHSCFGSKHKCLNVWTLVFADSLNESWINYQAAEH